MTAAQKKQTSVRGNNVVKSKDPSAMRGKKTAEVEPKKPLKGVNIGAAIPMRRPLPVNTAVDTQWFKDRLRDAEMSMRQLSALVEIDNSAMSLMLRGMRRMTADEAGRIAQRLGVPVVEVLTAAGVDVRGTGQNVVQVKGWVDEAGRVHQGPVVGPAVVPCPEGAAAPGMAALRMQGGLWDGWVLFHRDTRTAGVGVDAIGRLCLVRAVENGPRMLRWVQRGYERGSWNLVGLEGGEPVVSKLVSASPVLWMRP